MFQIEVVQRSYERSYERSHAVVQRCTIEYFSVVPKFGLAHSACQGFHNDRTTSLRLAATACLELSYKRSLTVVRLVVAVASDHTIVGRSQLVASGFSEL